MNIQTLADAKALGQTAAGIASQTIRDAIANQGEAAIILATGASQFEFLSALVAETSIDWSKVAVFHLDEYIGLGAEHPASFRRYLKERFLDRIPAPKAFNAVRGDAPDPAAECERLDTLIGGAAIDLACVGIGENGHLAFNDPPADFETEKPYLIVQLDEACRQQQWGEGWFRKFEDVPTTAISMSCRQIMKSRKIVCSVPDARKAEAVYNTVRGSVSNLVPASILQQHADCTLLLDRFSAGLLEQV